MHTFNWLVKIFNGSGSDAVNIQDGGNSITVDGALYEQSGTIYRGGTPYTVKHAYKDLSATGEVVAAVALKQILVTSYTMSASAALNVYFKSHTAGQIDSTKYLAANGGATKARDVDGVFAPTTAGEALDLNISGTGNCGVSVNYIEI